MKNVHKRIMSLVIGYTLLGATVYTVVISCLSLVGWVTFTFPDQQEKLFYSLIVEIILISVGQFKGVLDFNPAQVQGIIISDSDTAKQRLWELSSKVSPAFGKLTESIKIDLAKELTNWYYQGGGMYLSLKSADLFLKAKAALVDKRLSDEDVFNRFSFLRTQLKVDVGTYSPGDAEIQIGPDKSV